MSIIMEGEFPNFNAYQIEITGEPLVGAMIYLRTAEAWLSWDEVKELHDWLDELIKATPT